ncbi:unnamed protein product [Arctogadus glacialis]
MEDNTPRSPVVSPVMAAFREHSTPAYGGHVGAGPPPGVRRANPRRGSFPRANARGGDPWALAADVKDMNVCHRELSSPPLHPSEQQIRPPTGPLPRTPILRHGSEGKPPGSEALSIMEPRAPSDKWAVDIPPQGLSRRPLGGISKPTNLEALVLLQGTLRDPGFTLGGGPRKGVQNGARGVGQEVLHGVRPKPFLISGQTPSPAPPGLQRRSIEIATRRDTLSAGNQQATRRDPVSSRPPGDTLSSAGHQERHPVISRQPAGHQETPCQQAARRDTLSSAGHQQAANRPPAGSQQATSKQAGPQQAVSRPPAGRQQATSRQPAGRQQAGSRQPAGSQQAGAAWQPVPEGFRIESCSPTEGSLKVKTVLSKPQMEPEADAGANAAAINHQIPFYGAVGA